MKPKYFNSLGSLNNYADNFSINSFSFEHNPRKCQCDSVRCGFEVTDREDNEILEILVICPICAKNNAVNK